MCVVVVVVVVVVVCDACCGMSLGMDDIMDVGEAREDAESVREEGPLTLGPLPLPPLLPKKFFHSSG